MLRRASDLAVNPAHYKGDYVMRVIEDFNLDFLDGTVIKYLLRSGNKSGQSVLREHEKAEWYLQRKINNLRKVKK
jgi:hypothetical protein